MLFNDLVSFEKQTPQQISDLHVAAYIRFKSFDEKLSVTQCKNKKTF